VNTGELEHFGVKGMKWGVIRSKLGQKPGKSSGDAQKAEKVKAKIKTGGTKALTNKELKAVIERMRLEKQYKELKPDSVQKKAGKFVADLMLTAGKAEASKFVLSQSAKHVGKILAGLR
jgi:hypothetical protein